MLLMQKLRGIIVLLVLLSGTFSTNFAFAESPVITILGNNPETILKIRKKQAGKPKHSPLPQPLKAEVTP